jgi:hypothetical protein
MRGLLPHLPGKRYLDWDLTDPAGKILAQIRPIRDDIDTRVRAVLPELTATPHEHKADRDCAVSGSAYGTVDRGSDDTQLPAHRIDLVCY